MKVSKLQQALVTKKHKAFDQNQIVGIPAILQTYLGKSLLIWKIPQHGMKYYIGVDVSEGLGGKHGLLDYVCYGQGWSPSSGVSQQFLKPYYLQILLTQWADGITRHCSRLRKRLAVTVSLSVLDTKSIT